MAVFHENDNQVHELHGNHVTALSTPERGAPLIEMWRTVMDPGAATPPHMHDHEEVVFVVSGRGHGTVGGRTVTFTAGATIVLPPGIPHQLFADETFEAIAAMPASSRITTPDGETLALPWRS